MIHPEQERVQRLLSEAISLLCRNALPFKTDIQVDGLIGITIDKCDILLISLREQIESTLLHVTETVKTSNKYKDKESPSRQNRKRHTAVDQDQNSAVKSVRDSNAQESNAQDSNAQDSNASISPRRKYVKCESDEDISNGCERKEINNVSERLSPETKSTSAPSVSAVKNIMPSACVQVKQEESDECLVIESDDDHDPAVNTNHDNPADNLTHHGSWLSPVGSAWQLNSSHAAFPEIQEQVSWSFDGIGNAASAGSSSENMFDSTLANDAIRDQCLICHKLIRRGNMARHKREVHLNMKNHICPHCGSAYGQKFQMQQHILLKHRPECAAQCPQCSKVYSSQDLLQQHYTRTGHAQHAANQEDSIDQSEQPPEKGLEA